MVYLLSRAHQMDTHLKYCHKQSTYAYTSKTEVPFFPIATSHAKCNWNSLWVSIWSKAILHVWHLLAKIMDCWDCFYNNYVPCVNFCNTIFRLLGQEEDAILNYLQAQLKNMDIGCLPTFSFKFHVLLSWIFVSKLNLGTPGAMDALTISSWLMVIRQLVYIFGGWCPNTWRGSSISAFTDVLPVVKLSYPMVGCFGNSCPTNFLSTCSILFVGTYMLYSLGWEIIL